MAKLMTCYTAVFFRLFILLTAKNCELSIFFKKSFRSICLEDVLSFHSNEKACAFNKNDFDIHVLNKSKNRLKLFNAHLFFY